MILCLDVGNTQIFGGVFQDHELVLRFRHDSRTQFTSDQLGIFLKAILRENKLDPDLVRQIALSSVVPSLDYTVSAACQKYFDLQPFRLTASVNTGLVFQYQNPGEIGADRIANAIACAHFYPDTDCIIIDFGTATTLCVLTKNKQYLAGPIMPGMRLSMDALQQGTAKLSSVNIVEAKNVLGQTTREGIQAGLYYAQLGAIERMIVEIKQQKIIQDNYTVVGTGGFAHLFLNQNLFHHHMPELILHGLRYLLDLNRTQITGK